MLEPVNNPQIHITTEPPSLGGFFVCSVYPSITLSHKGIVQRHIFMRRFWCLNRVIY